jgi:hypothetical protein
VRIARRRIKMENAARAQVKRTNIHAKKDLVLRLVICI